jgi:hypothetical protein
VPFYLNQAIDLRQYTVAAQLSIEAERRERILYECAVAVEQDVALQQEMAEWDVTSHDGLL